MEPISTLKPEAEAKLLAAHQSDGRPEEIRSTTRGSECACRGTGFVRVFRGASSAVHECECLKKRKLERRLLELPERFRQSTFENYAPVDPRQFDALEVLQGNPSKSFFLWGDYARGKTHLAVAQYRALVESGQSVAWRSMGELLAELTAASVRDETSLVIQNIRHADSFHLFVDDLDKFKSTEFKHEVLFELFDMIYRRKLGVTLTSNYGLRFLVETERVHPAIVRRIDDMCQVVNV